MLFKGKVFTEKVFMGVYFVRTVFILFLLLFMGVTEHI